MSEVVKMPKGTVTFETDAGAKFEVPVLQLTNELREISEEYRRQYAALVEQGKQDEADKSFGHYVFLATVQEICRQRYQVELTLEEADYFKDELEVAFAKKKRMQLESINARLNSAFSMAGSIASPAAGSATMS